MLAALLHRLDARRSERQEAKDEQQAFEDFGPPFDGLVRDLQVLAQGIQRERGADQRGEPDRQLFQRPEFVHTFEVGDVLAHEAGAVLPRPAARLRRRPRKEWLGERAERHQVGERAARLLERERVQPQVMIAPLQ